MLLKCWFALTDVTGLTGPTVGTLTIETRRRQCVFYAETVVFARLGHRARIRAGQLAPASGPARGTSTLEFTGHVRGLTVAAVLAGI